MQSGKRTQKVNRKTHGGSRAFRPERFPYPARCVLYPASLADTAYLSNHCNSKHNRLTHMEKQSKMVGKGSAL